VATAVDRTATSAIQRPFSGQEFRQAVGSFATGVTVVTTNSGDEKYGMTANSFTSVSLDPPLVLVCAISGTEGSDVISRNGKFAVNILAHDQEPISRFFASKDRPRGADAFRDISHRDGVTGCPIIDGCAGHLDCLLHSSSEAGDHIIFIGAVQALGCENEIQPLLFHSGKYRLVQV
jgi:flavin reductase (DIM6/NTAB) family NADH-FMN oxidoreductase RutF